MQPNYIKKKLLNPLKHFLFDKNLYTPSAPSNLSLFLNGNSWFDRTISFLVSVAFALKY